MSNKKIADTLRALASEIEKSEREYFFSIAGDATGPARIQDAQACEIDAYVPRQTNYTILVGDSIFVNDQSATTR